MSIDRTVVRTCPDPWVSGCKIYDYLHDSPLNPLPGYSAALSMNQLARGKADGQRVGRQARVRRLAIKYWITAADTQLASVYSRLLVFIDRQFTGTGATPSQVLAQASITSWQNQYTRDRFVIVYDETHTMDQSSHGGGATSTHFQTPLTTAVLDVDLLLTFKGSLGTDMRGNNLSFFVLTEAGGFTNAYLHLTSRIFYEDL